MRQSESNPLAHQAGLLKYSNLLQRTRSSGVRTCVKGTQSLSIEMPDQEFHSAKPRCEMCVVVWILVAEFCPLSWSRIAVVRI